MLNKYMRLSEFVVSALLCLLIVSDAPVPKPMSEFVSSVPGIVVIAGALLYIFTKSPCVGLLAAVAVYVLMQKSVTVSASPLLNLKPDIPPMETEIGHQFPVSLEENIIRTMVPMSRESVATTYVSNCVDDTHNAVDV